MPELPEVQTIINNLKHIGVLNKTIIAINVFKEKIIKNCSVDKFKNFFIKEKFIGIERIGKYLIFKLTHHKVLTVHLRMEGKLFYEKQDSDYPKQHLRIQFNFSNNHALNYYDSRMFGTFHIYDGDQYLQSTHIQKVALDPLDKRFNAKYLWQRIHKINRFIKTTLLDQTIVSGIGNIYADEILFLSHIHPLTKSCNLSLANCTDIVKSAIKVLELAIKHGGTTVSSYKWDPKNHGGFQKYLKVHARKGESCYICGTKIDKIKVNGRGTYFCKKCQKLIGR